MLKLIFYENVINLFMYMEKNRYLVQKCGHQIRSLHKLSVFHKTEDKTKNLILQSAIGNLV